MTPGWRVDVDPLDAPRRLLPGEQRGVDLVDQVDGAGEILQDDVGTLFCTKEGECRAGTVRLLEQVQVRIACRNLASLPVPLQAWSPVGRHGERARIAVLDLPP